VLQWACPGVPGAPSERPPGLLLVALFSRLRVGDEGWPHRQPGGPAGPWASRMVSSAKHEGAVRGHNWVTSSKVRLSDFLWVVGFFFLSSGICCGSQAFQLCRACTEIPVSAPTHHWLIFQSNLLVRPSLPSHTHAKVFLLLFSSSCLLPASPYTNQSAQRRWL